jgi:hypothetical protein
VSVLVLSLVAPLVGRPRRYVLWSLLPGWGVVIAYRFGEGLARVSSGRQAGIYEADLRSDKRREQVG